MSLMLIPTSSMPWPENTSSMGPACACTSISIMRSSSLPARSWARSLSRVASREASGTPLRGCRSRRLPLAPRQQEVEEPVLGQRSARSRTAAAISALTMLTPSSVRSRIIDSTSRPT